MLEIAQTNLFKKQLKRCCKRGWDVDSINKVVSMLQKEEMLPEKYRDHALSGRDSSVGIATRYGLNGPGIESYWERDFPHPS